MVKPAGFTGCDVGTTGWPSTSILTSEDAVISSASFDAPMARVTVRFTADIAAVTRNAEGVVIAGSLNDAVEAQDLWTFSRNVRSTDPDWLLDETDEA